MLTSASARAFAVSDSPSGPATCTGAEFAHATGEARVEARDVRAIRRSQRTVDGADGVNSS